MINAVWLGLILSSIVISFINGTQNEVANALVTSSKSAVNLAIGLIGLVSFWMGLMHMATDSGLIQSLSKIIRPIIRPLFPEVPPEHPAMGAIIMNMAANMMGIGNAATPFGLKAMEHLQDLNPDKNIASNSMCMLLAINTSSIQLIPITGMAILASSGATNVTSIILPAFLATSFSTLCAIVACKVLERNSRVPGMSYDINAIAELLSNLLLFTLVGGIPLAAALKRIDAFGSFLTGAKEGFDVCIKLIPFLVGFFIAIGMFRAAGGFELLAQLLGSILAKAGVPSELLPMILIRPFSGSAANGVLADIATSNGGDSLIAKMAATIMGSSETTFYVLMVYFGAVGIKRARHALAAGLIADLGAVIASIALINWFWS